MEKVYHGKHYTIRIKEAKIQEVSPEVRTRIEAARKELDKVIFGICDRLVLGQVGQVGQVGTECTE
ncbi:MAG: hypothetical protein IIV93_04745 [Clostridia bacterium]|nr:hypothetical protein [Clostridia bacterium]